ncbi:MAG TPA: hypothetical protein PK789_11420, partial [Thermomonas sp.]|uniref:hypothetical protein n=1 Tax=Thermomonas sp. TaxID=1971895 RepID=UPI002C58D040
DPSVFSCAYVATPHAPADAFRDRPSGGKRARTRTHYSAHICGTIRRVSNKRTTPKSKTPHRKVRGFSFWVFTNLSQQEPPQ